MADQNSLRENRDEPPIMEPAWVTKMLWLAPRPAFAIAGMAFAVFASSMCFFFASAEQSPVGWTLCGAFAALAALIGAACVSRHRHRRRLVASDSPRPIDPIGRPTAAIIVLLMSVISWMLMIGLHVFRNAFAANRPGGLKYNVTFAIALASTAYMTLHGRSVIRKHFGAQGGRNLPIAPRQALAVIALMLGFGVYFAWIMS